MSYSSMSEHTCTYACAMGVPDSAIAIYIAVQPFLISASVIYIMYMGVCMQLGDVYMGRCIAGIDIQF